MNSRRPPNTFKTLPIQSENSYSSLSLGNSKSMRTLTETIEKVAKNRLPIYISGPTGAGKEWIAQRLHQQGLNANAPFVDVNCGAIAEQLLESLFFGHVKGSFTGATQSCDGYFNLVGEGTLFLDEIGELPLAMQPKLLRVLETGLFRPIGARESKKFCGRVVVATHRNLEKMITEGSFREDLFHRINVIKLTVPPLSERREDIPLLITHFAGEMNKRFSEEAIQLLATLEWPGNVRELRNTVLRLCVLTTGDLIDSKDIENSLAIKKPDINQITESITRDILLLKVEKKLDYIEHALIQEALLKSAGNKCAAARLLGINRKILERKISKFDKNLAQLINITKRAQLFLASGQYTLAIPLLKNAEKLLASLPETLEIDKYRFDIYLKLGVCMRNTGGWADKRVINCYDYAMQIAKRSQNIQELATVLFGSWAVELIKLNLDTATEAAQKLYQMGLDSNQDTIIGQGLAALANTAFWRGDMDGVSRAVDEYLFHRKFRSLMSDEAAFDAYPIILEFKCLREIVFGYFSAAEITRTEISHYFQCTSNTFVKVIALQALIWTTHLLEGCEKAVPFINELLSLCKEGEYSFYIGFGMIFKGSLLCRTHYEEGISTIISGFFDYMNPDGGQLFSSYFRVILAEHYAKNRDWNKCRLTAIEALQICDQKGEITFRPKLMLLISTCQFALQQKDEALNETINAWNLAKKLGLRLLQLEVACFWLEHFNLISVKTLAELQQLLASFHSKDAHPLIKTLQQLISHSKIVKKEETWITQ